VLAGPVCQRPTSALPRLPLSLPHPTADTGPRCCLTPPVSRVALAPPPSPVCQPAFAMSARYPLRPRRPEPFRPHGPPADPPPISLFLPPSRGTSEPTLPPFPSLLSPRASRFGEDAGASLRFVSHLSPSSSSPPSPPPTRLPHRLPPSETPPPLRFPSERHSLRRCTVRPSHPLPLSQFEAVLTFPLPH
jgi:hypothetical protein